ncbi:MAG: hypothetical protein WCS99_21735, partial [Limisphaerales bacterium]
MSRPKLADLCLALVLLPTALAFAATAEPTVDLKELPRLKPVAPADAVKTFAIRPGFQAQLVAHEPLV